MLGHTIEAGVEAEAQANGAGSMSLAELADVVAKDPAATRAILDAVEKRLGGLGQPWATPERRRQFEEAFRKSDKAFLDRFPILSSKELAAAGAMFSSRREPPKEPAMPARS